jgi:hypothetical protein
MRSVATTLTRLLFTFASLWGLLAGLAVLVTAGGTVVIEGNDVSTAQHIGWVEMQGAWGVIILLVFAALYYGPLHFYRRGRRGLSAVFALAAVALTGLAGFSIGGYYFIGGLALLLGLLLFPFNQA